MLMGEIRSARYVLNSKNIFAAFYLALIHTRFILWTHDLCQADLEEVAALYLDAKSSARLLEEQQEKYIT